MWIRNPICCIDPRVELKIAKQQGDVSTLVDYEYISALA
jgi:hypothetical protein